MERLLMLRMQAKGCAVEAHLNGMCVARLGAAGGVVTLPVHEYTLSGKNQISFTASTLPNPAAQPTLPLISQGDLSASLQLALCHKGQSPEDANARMLTQLSWAPTLNEKHDWPFTLSQSVELPVTFPRWRWMDAPLVQVNDNLSTQVLTLLQSLALDFQRGDPEAFLQLTRFRIEELALAYQLTPQVCAQKFRAHFQQLFEAGVLGAVSPPKPGSIELRVLADGRLVEPVLKDGSPALMAGPVEGSSHVATWWPLRLAQVEGKLYALR